MDFVEGKVLCFNFAGFDVCRRLMLGLSVLLPRCLLLAMVSLSPFYLLYIPMRIKKIRERGGRAILFTSKVLNLYS